jgi:hypothetical protein
MSEWRQAEPFIVLRRQSAAPTPLFILIIFNGSLAGPE